jgi:hypothetical protein
MELCTALPAGEGRGQNRLIAPAPEAVATLRRNDQGVRNSLRAMVPQAECG